MAVNTKTEKMETTPVAETSVISDVIVPPPELKKPLVPVAETEKKKMKVLVAIDESDLSFYALEWALDNLFRYSSASATAPELNQQDSDTVFVVHVTEPFHHYVVPLGPPVVYARLNMESVKKAQAESAAAILSHASKMCLDKKVKAETLVLEGEVKEMICEAVEKMNVDLLVVGSRGLGKIKRAFLGSVSDYCAHHAKCPILIVKPPKESHHKESHK